MLISTLTILLNILIVIIIIFAFIVLKCSFLRDKISDVYNSGCREYYQKLLYEKTGFSFTRRDGSILISFNYEEINYKLFKIEPSGFMTINHELSMNMYKAIIIMKGIIKLSESNPYKSQLDEIKESNTQIANVQLEKTINEFK